LIQIGNIKIRQAYL